MRNLLALLGLAVVLFVGLGWYLGWYHVALTPTANGKKVEFDIDTSKVKDDVSAGYEKGKDLIDTFRKDKSPAPEGSKDFVGPPKPETPTPASGKPAGPGPVLFK